MKEPIYLIELFAGIGSQAKALKNIGLNVIHHKVIEFDKYAIASYNAIHNTNFKPTDITTIKGQDLEILNTQFYNYLMTYSFPCQDLSLAGKGAGMTKGNSTRSGLLWEVERLLNECKELPQYLLLENVPQIHSKKNIDDFELWQKFLEQKGYNNYWQDLNAKNYGIPQNRNRTFMISIRKDIDLGYDFPQPFELKLRLKDMLEQDVDEKYYLSDKMVQYISADNEKWTGNNNHAIINKTIASTLNTGEGSRRCDASNYICDELPENFDLKGFDKVIVAGKLEGESWDKIHQCCRKIYDENGISPTLDTMSGGYRQPKICVVGKTKSGGQRSLILDEDGICNCLSATDYKQPKQILIREKTKKGYAETTDGDGVYINRPHQKRGCVQKGMIQTIKTTPNDVGVVVVGNYSPSGHNASRVVDPDYIAPTVMENHGTVTGVLLKEQLCNKLIEEGLVEEGDVIRHSYTKNRLNNGVDNMRRTESKDKLCPTLDTRCDCLGVVVKDKNLWTDTQKQMITDDGNVKRYLDSDIVDEFKEGQVADISFPNGYNKVKRVHDECPTINQTTTQSSFITKITQTPLRIRKLTPKECWRLMGFSDTDFDKAAQFISNAQLYKQAGNSIVVNVLEHIFKELFKERKEKKQRKERYQKMSIFDFIGE